MSRRVDARARHAARRALLLTLGIIQAGYASRLAAVPRLVPIVEAQRSSVVRVKGFLSEEDIQRIHKTASLVAETTETHDLHRRQGAPQGSWMTVFLNHRLELLLPDIHERMMEAAIEADREHWQLLDASRHELNLRVSEYHRVLPSGGIPMAKHHDYGSLLTMDLMLSEGGVDFEGGRFQTLESNGELKSHAFEQGDLLIFQSHKYHCVSEVTSGRRTVLVSELWEGLPRRCVKRCNTPWGPCVCEFGVPPQLYRRAKHQDAQLEGAAFSKLRPCIRHFSKSTEDLEALSASLATAGPEKAAERDQLGAHMAFVKGKELDRARQEALDQARGEVHVSMPS